jgi:hypothetical protein
MLPRPPSKQWALRVSKPFRDYFETIADAKSKFLTAITDDTFEYVANVRSMRTLLVEDVNAEADD